MIVWRLVKARHLHRAYSGESGLYVGGRWLPKGYRVVYTSENASLAVAENIVNADPSELVGQYWFVPAEVPNDLLRTGVLVEDLPDDWRSVAQYKACRHFGVKWHEHGRDVALRVPSAVVPNDHNFLLNPDHPRFAEIEFLDPIEYHFDERLAVD